VSDRVKVRTNPDALAVGMTQKLSEIEVAIARQAQRFAAVMDISLQISRARDVDELLTSVMGQLAMLVKADAATLFVHDREASQLWAKVMRGASLKEIRLSDSEGIAGHVFQTGETVHVGDAYQDVRFHPDIDKQSGFKTRSIIAAPLRHVRSRRLGVVEVLHSDASRFGPEDRVLVEAVASQIAAVLDNVLLVDELKKRGDQLMRRVRELDILYEAEQGLSVSDGETDLVDRLLTKAMESTRAKAGSILLADADRDSLYFRNTKGDGTEGLKAMRQSAGQGISGHVAATGQVVRVLEATDSEHFDKTLIKRLGITVSSVLCVPLRGEGRVVGALELLNKKGGFSEGDERLAVLLAGQIGRALVTMQSRTELEQKARMATIGQMLAGVLHDLRTPLTVIGGYAEMMADEASEATRREMTASILTQIEHVKSMQKETLDFARGERTLLLRKVFMHLFLKSVEEQLAQEFSRTNVELKVLMGYGGAAKFDENKLKRVIFNLARNAIDAMPDGGRFVLSVDREEDDLVFRCQDNGPGIPPEIHDRLFESFVTSGKKHGTGLGLAIVRKIIDEHKGSVTFRSRFGKGTTFEVRIPTQTPRES
jgi:K+-sensing histidine kinase KdpD